MKLDEQYKEVVKTLEKDYGWLTLKGLPDSYVELLCDVIKATRQVNKISLNPLVIGSLPDECVYANVLPHKPGYVCLNKNLCEKCRQ